MALTNPAVDPEKPATTDDEIVAEAKARFELCVSVDDGDRDDSLDDLRFLKGDQWDEQAIRERELDGRPTLVFNNLPAILHQVTNDVRQNKQSIHVHPVDDGADVETAEVIEGILRHIEYDSGADAAYDTALDGAASIGFGYFRLVTEYCSPMSFDQDMKIKRIRNPFTVYIDPTAQEADGSDMQYAFVSTKMKKDEFKRLYPKAEFPNDSIGRGVGDTGHWVGEDWVRVTEYYRIEYTKETLVLLSDGSTRVASDRSPMPEGVLPTAHTRETWVPRIMWYKLSATQVLERQEVPFDWIPIFPVYGDEIDIDGFVTRSGLVRHAKGPKQMENYWNTAATEEIALRTKTPFIGALGQFEGLEDDWESANTRNFSYLEYNPVSVDGNLAPAPQRQAPADVPSGYIAMAALARDTVKAVTGIYDASLGARGNETSGKGIQARQRQSDVSNFHYSDNLSRAIRHLGRTMISGIPRVYDSQRVMRIMGTDGTAKSVQINQPVPPMEQKPDPKTGAIKRVLNDLTVGTYDCVVSTGPAYNTLREESADAMVTMGANWPKLMDTAGDIVVRSMDWPNAGKIADRLEKTMPPGLVDDDNADETMVQTPNGPIPAQEAGQLIDQMNHALEMANNEIEKFEAGIQKAQIDAESREKVAEINNTGKMDAAELAGMVDLLLAGIQPMIAEQMAQVAANAPRPIAEQEASQEAHEQTMEQAEQSAQHQSDLSAQNAEQQPDPDAGNDASAPKGA